MLNGSHSRDAHLRGDLLAVADQELGAVRHAVPLALAALVVDDDDLAVAGHRDVRPRGSSTD